MKNEDLQRQFGPKLIDAILKQFLEELNEVRTKAGLPEKTEQTIVDKIDTKIKAIKDYTWMSKK